jgi:phosphatidylglycerol:prolipoprotein diacylglycerol transferase
VRSTLFVIPAEFAGVPVFGLGWLLLAWIVISVAGLAMLTRRRGWSGEAAGTIPLVLMVAAAIALFLPMLVETGPGGIRGVPVRGFGVMFMLAAIASVGLAAYRAWQIGLDPEIIVSLSFTMLLAGIVGARVFYVVQYWPEFSRPTIAETLQALANFTKGGLVVYGAVLVGLPAGIWFLHRRHLPILPMADLIAPSMVLGQAIGRIGCFLNGCCYGGVMSRRGSRPTTRAEIGAPSPTTTVRVGEAAAMRSVVSTWRPRASRRKPVPIAVSPAPPGYMAAGPPSTGDAARIATTPPRTRSTRPANDGGPLG